VCSPESPTTNPLRVVLNDAESAGGARVYCVNGLPDGVRACFASLQQTDNSSQRLPGRLVQCRVRPDEVADHLPGSNVEGAIGCWSHSQGDGARGAETDSPCRRLLPRSYSHGLREHKYTNGFVSNLELPMAAKTTQVLQRSPPGGHFPQQNTAVTR